jgi:hypothetical protein
VREKCSTSLIEPSDLFLAPFSGPYPGWAEVNIPIIAIKAQDWFILQNNWYNTTLIAEFNCTGPSRTESTRGNADLFLTQSGISQTRTQASQRLRLVAGIHS